LISNSALKPSSFLTWAKRNNSKWMQFDFSPELVENEKLWQLQKINSNPETHDSKVEILSIDTSGKVVVEYEYAEKGRIFSLITDKRKLVYEITQRNGHLALVSISKEN